ncbi:MAG: nitroreductase [Myxococcales bacterium]|nr:nitroreductase [Myxococcales bacterium]
MADPDLARVLAYHTRTKHRPGRYAASLGYLDWDSQPNPFRIHDGAELLPLARAPLRGGPSLAALRDPRPAAPLDAAALDVLLFHSLALSAWKQAGGSRWSLRVNPSSGNLHPTEAYLIAPAIRDLSEEPALFHYSPLLHALERRAILPDPIWSALSAALPTPSLLVGLASIPWREAWKYGERSFRYCQHDLGHAIAALAHAAALLGWSARELPAPGDAALAALLGLRDLDGEECEIPEALVLLTPSNLSPGTSALRAWTPPADVVAWFAAAELRGAPNQLSEAHHPWPILADIAEATRRPERAAPAPSVTAGSPHDPAPPAPRDAPTATASPSSGPDDSTALAAPPSSQPGDSTVPAPSSARDATASPSSAPDATASPSSAPDAAASPSSEPDAAALIRRRRSAVAMDGRTGISRDAFYAMLLRAAAGDLPLTALADPPRVDLAVFVHRVADLDPGLYLNIRDPARADRWRAATDPEFAWTAAPGLPRGLDLRLLRAADARVAAASIACGQDIAADGCFALAMLADFTALQASPSTYRRLFWETGAIGQVLYLEAEALGVSATGIGCFFDDPMHALLGLTSEQFQSLYHFTVGGRVDDPRLKTLDPYHHLTAPGA